MSSFVKSMSAILLTFLNFILTSIISIKFGNSLANFIVDGNIKSVIFTFIVWVTSITIHVLCSMCTQVIINTHKLRNMANIYADIYKHYENTGELILYDISYSPIKEYSLRQQWSIRILILTCLILILLVSYSFKSSIDSSTTKINNSIVQMQEQKDKMKNEIVISGSNSYKTENK